MNFSVSIVIRQRARRPASIPGRAESSSLYHRVLIGSGAQPAYPMGTWEFLRESKAAGARADH